MTDLIYSDFLRLTSKNVEYQLLSWHPNTQKSLEALKLAEKGLQILYNVPLTIHILINDSWLYVEFCKLTIKYNVSPSHMSLGNGLKKYT